ncbi:MAG: GNAT family N-acetyltransferase [Actinobacteria bacterium]|nr:GNAT family N-acetyltransferase [Actinomycetota bacterium]
MCFIAEEGGRILHASWVTTSGAWTREVQALLSPPPGDAYVYESFTRSEARGRGIYPLALAGMLTELSRLGIRRVWVGVESSNQASRRAIGKAGFEEALSIRFWRDRGRLSVGVPIGSLADEDGHYWLGARQKHQGKP